MSERKFEALLLLPHASIHCSWATDIDILLQRALKERGIDKMLDEARADNRENDLENMKPGSG